MKLFLLLTTLLLSLNAFSSGTVGDSGSSDSDAGSDAAQALIDEEIEESKNEAIEAAKEEAVNEAKAEVEKEDAKE